MRPSVCRHVLAFLRKELGLNQSDFAELTGNSTPTIQAVELGRLKLSEAVAMKIFAATGADPVWMRANDLSAAHIHRRTGKPYTKAHFEEAQARLHAPSPRDRAAMDEELISAAAWQWSVLSSAMQRNQRSASVVLYRINKFMAELMAEFGLDFAVYNGKNRQQALELLEEKLAQCRTRAANGRVPRAPSAKK